MANNSDRKTELLESVLSEHYDTVFSYILVSLDYDRELANDCMQDAVTLVMEKTEAVSAHPNPGGFFIVTAKNFVLKYKARRKKLGLTVPYDEAMAEAVYTEDFDRLFEERINIETIKQELLNRLDDKEFGLYSMFYEKNLSVSQIAGSLRISEGNVKVRLFRLRAKVKKMVSALFANRR